MKARRMEVRFLLQIAEQRRAYFTESVRLWRLLKEEKGGNGGKWREMEGKARYLCES